MAEQKKRGRRENLITTADMTEEERKAFAKRGAKASAEARAQRKTFKEALDWYLSLEVTPDMTENDAERALIERFPGLTARDLIAINMASTARSKSSKSSVKAAAFVRDTTGELPAQTVNVQQEKAFEITIKTLD